jgi:hypothetical protein
MASNIKRKRSFGSVTVDQFSPESHSEYPTTIDIKLTFREALKLHLGLGRLLGHLTINDDRAAPQGRKAGVKLCLRPATRRITIHKGSAK